MSLKALKPQGQKWMDEEPSVFDFPGENMLRSLAKLVVPGPEDMAQPTQVGPAAPLVTIFKNTAARKLATQEFLDKMTTMLPGNWSQAASEFAENYPRVAAHIMPKIGKPIDPGDLAQIMPRASSKSPIDLNISIEGARAGIKDLGEARRLMFEEGTHVAQGLGSKHTDRLYTKADDILGYSNNPYELSAKETADRWANQLGGHGSYPPMYGGRALEMLKESVSNPAMPDMPAVKAVRGYFNRKR